MQAFADMKGSSAGVQVARAHLHKPFTHCSNAFRCSTHKLRPQPPSFSSFRRNIPARAAMRLLVAGLCVASVSAGEKAHGPGTERGRSIPGLTHSGYLIVDSDAGSKLFYMFYEAQECAGAEQAPICLWLQARTSPSLFIAFGPKRHLFIALGQREYTHLDRRGVADMQYRLWRTSGDTFGC